jgi:hypothetical protein
VEFVLWWVDLITYTMTALAPDNLFFYGGHGRHSSKVDHYYIGSLDLLVLQRPASHILLNKEQDALVDKTSRILPT